MEHPSDFSPLAARFRPRTIDEYFGQQHILATGKPLRTALDKGQLHSMIFWGPPGVGKTTLAKILANNSNAHYIELSAVLAGVKDIRAAVEQAKLSQRQGMKTLLFIDEIHRFSKSQQDSLLSPVEQGTVILIGATTENPSFELNNALLSRLRVYVLRALSIDCLSQLLKTALHDKKRGLGHLPVEISDDLLSIIARSADGDARRSLNLLQIAVDLAEHRDGVAIVNEYVVNEALQGHLRRFDNKGEQFYDQISALHKSVRGSNPDAALYWFCRMIDGGCDPIYIARRVVRIASEDIGNADPRALPLTLAAWDSYERLGSPEGELAIAQAIVYLAIAAKSNAVYMAYNQALVDAKHSGSLEVPLHLRNAPTKLMQDLDYGKDYRYAHNEQGAYAAGEVYLPEALQDRRYYEPVERGLEIKIKQKLDYLREQDRLAQNRQK